MLTARLAAFEIRYQLRNPVFWVSVAIFFLLGFGLAASENVSFGSPGSVHENSPYTAAISMAPSLGCSKPAMRRRDVVLPQPDGPRKEWNEPRFSAKLTSSTALTSPKCLTTERNSTS